MPTFPEQFPGGWRRFGAALKRLQREVDSLRQRPFAIPVLDEDPPAGDPTNLWMFNDGRLRGRDAEGRIREWVPTIDARPQVPTFATNPAVSTGWRIWTDGNGNLRVRQANDGVRVFNPTTTNASGDGAEGTVGGSTTTDTKPVETIEKSYISTYTADASRCYKGSGAQHGAHPLFFGKYDPGLGHLRSWIGFDDATIRTDLTGATIRKIELFMLSGSILSQSTKIDLQGHNNDGVPTEWGDVAVVSEYAAAGTWNLEQAKWLTLPSSFGEALRDDLIKGVVIVNPATSTRYGYVVGVGGVSPPRLRITYTK